MPDPLLHARALVLHDLAVGGLGGARAVDVVDDAVSGRRWWVEQWPEGGDYVAGQVAQDVQDALLDGGRRWPACPRHTGTVREHALQIDPELGPDPHWVCETDAVAIAPLGAL